MRYLLVYAVFLVIATGCKDRVPTKKKVPANIIGKETMAKIFADIHIAEKIVNTSSRKNDSDKIKLNKLYFVIFKKYGISKEEFQKSLDYYLNNPDILAEVYENTAEILNTKQVE